MRKFPCCLGDKVSVWEGVKIAHLAEPTLDVIDVDLNVVLEGATTDRANHAIVER